jgi:O-antigen/teichoic acid export membrane protein
MALFSSVIGSLGLGTLIMRLWPEYMAKGEQKLAVQSMVWAIKKAFLFSLIPAGLIFVIFMIFDITELKDYYDLKFGLSIAILSIGMSLSEFISAALRAQGKLTLALVPRDIGSRLFVILGMGFVYLSDIPVDASEVLLYNAAVLLSLAFVQIIISDLKDTLKGNQNATNEYKSEWLRLAEPIWFGAIVFSSTMQVDMMLVGFFLDAETIAAYFAALKIASVLALPIIAINQLSSPMISKYFHSGEVSTLQKNLRLYLIFCAVVVSPIFLIIVFYGKFLLGLFNPVFVDAYFVLVALSVGYLFQCLSGPAGNFLQMTGRSTLALKTSSATQAIALLIFPLVATSFGSFGIALIRMFEMALRNFLQSLHGYRIFSINTSIAAIFSNKFIEK